jgi:Sugar-transfer associated ATP-grasp
MVLRTLQERCWSFFYKRCLVGFPWFWPAKSPGVPAMVAARRMVRRHYGRNHHPVYRALAQVLVAIVWPAAVLIALWDIRRMPVPIRRVPGAFWAALRHNVMPGEYLAYGLWQSDRKANIDNYLYGNEAPRLFKLLNRPLQGAAIGDKLAFNEMCRANEVPSPEILAAFTPTGVLLEFEFGQPPKRDLFVKLRIGLGSEGVERFRWCGGVFESERGCQLNAEDLGGYLATRAVTENRTLLVQPVLSNHPELPVDANANLATARLVTGISNEGVVIPIFGFFIYTVKTDRLVRVALIDVTSGRLVSAGQHTMRVSHQLDIGSDDAGALPDWDTVLELTEVAHRACSNFVFVGWDVAFTERGAVLLEGNANWGATEYQRLQSKPLGYTKFAEILASRLHDLETS